MKKIRFLIFAVLWIAIAVILTGCGSPKLATPKDLSVTNKTLSWSAVENASGYVVEINDASYQIRRTYYSFESEFLPEGNYVFKVKAVASGYSDSDWATVEYYQPAESGLSYSLTDDGNGYEVVAVGRAKGEITIDDTYNGLPVVGIGYRAFNGNLDVTSIELGKNVRYIGERAFYGCTELTSVKLNDGLEKIGEMAFQSCRVLESIIIPDSVTEIADFAFAYCRGATEIKIGSSVKSLGTSAFMTNTAVEEITIPASVSSLGAEAFSNCTELKKLVVKGKSLEAGERAFLGCTSLVSVDLGDCEVEISSNMFYGCSSLGSVVLNDNIKKIGAYAFMECSSLESVDLGEYTQSIGQSAFYGTALYNNSESNIVIICDWVVGVKNSEELYDINSISSLNIVGIANNAFMLCNNLSVMYNLPKTLRYIGERAFAGCENLYDIILPANIVEIGDYAFLYCDSLSGVIIGDNASVNKLKSIGKYAFAYTSLNSINLPDSITEIGTYAFYKTVYWDSQYSLSNGIIIIDKWIVGCNPDFMGGLDVSGVNLVGVADYAFAYCSGLGKVVLPDTVKYVGKGAFYGCTGMYAGEFTFFPMLTVSIPAGVTEIRPYTFYASAVVISTLPASVKKIGSYAYGASGLVMIDIPDSVTEIDSYAFWACQSLQTIELPANLTTIKSGTFNSCDSLRKVTMPDTVTEICDNAFFRCDLLMDINLSPNVKSIGDYAFYMCSELESIEIPDKVTSIGEYAFYKCEKLKSVKLSDSLESIGDFAFYGCIKLTDVVFPQSLESIGRSAFRTCVSLTGIMLHNGITYIGEHAFYGNRNLTFYCEAESAPESYDSLWNSTFRPVVWNCTFDETKSYVVSAEISEISNYNAINGVSAPTREGYEFKGWATDAYSGNVLYTCEDLDLVYDGTVLYAVWEPSQPVAEQQ